MFQACKGSALPILDVENVDVHCLSFDTVLSSSRLDYFQINSAFPISQPCDGLIKLAAGRYVTRLRLQLSFQDQHCLQSLGKRRAIRHLDDHFGRARWNLRPSVGLCPHACRTDLQGSDWRLWWRGTRTPVP